MKATYEWIVTLQDADDEEMKEHERAGTSSAATLKKDIAQAVTDMLADIEDEQED